MKKLFDIVIKGYGYFSGLEYQDKFIGLSLGQAVAEMARLKVDKSYLYSDIMTVDFYDYGTTDEVNYIVIPLFTYNTLKNKDMTLLEIANILYRNE